MTLIFYRGRVLPAGSDFVLAAVVEFFAHDFNITGIRF